MGTLCQSDIVFSLTYCQAGNAAFAVARPQGMWRLKPIDAQNTFFLLCSTGKESHFLQPQGR